MGRLVKLVLWIVVTALVAGGAAYWVTRGERAKVFVTIDTIRKVARLATVEYHLSAVRSEGYFSRGIRGKTDHVFATRSGKVRGEIDLEGADVVMKKDAQGDVVSVHFKRGSVRVSGVEVDPATDRNEVVSCRREVSSLFGFGKEASPGQQAELARKTLEAIRETAIANGIVAKTKENAKAVLGAFISSLGHRAEITFAEDAYVAAR